MTNREEVRAYIPEDNAWHDADIKAKAEKLDMKKSEFILSAVDTFLNFDIDFLKAMQNRVIGLKVPMYVAIQNTIIAQLAKDQARQNVLGGMGAKREEFPMYRGDDGRLKLLTGKALEENLIELYTKEFEQEKLKI